MYGLGTQNVISALMKTKTISRYTDVLSGRVDW
jgi:hypothetical protein